MEEDKLEELKEGMFKPDEKLLNFDKHGITEDYLIGKLKEELEAEETKFFQKDGIVTEKRDVTDWNTRQDARKDAHKLRGDYPVEKVDHTGGIIVNIEATPIKKKKKED